MSIKSDNWIRRMAREHAMIEPFEPGQVREIDGRKIVSYGTSSYGYDVRCAREFKIFTNINSTIVDPKQFDEKSFVDVTQDVCQRRRGADAVLRVGRSVLDLVRRSRREVHGSARSHAAEDVGAGRVSCA